CTSSISRNEPENKLLRQPICSRRQFQLPTYLVAESTANDRLCSSFAGLHSVRWTVPRRTVPSSGSSLEHKAPTGAGGVLRRGRFGKDLKFKRSSGLKPVTCTRTFFCLNNTLI